ncbi:AfsR/SARP family transcriptional regulator [Streptomyces sp. NPDC003691]
MRFGVLGPLTVTSAAGGSVVVPEAKVRALLAVLLTVPGQPVAADRLVDLLWGGAPPANPPGALQTLVSRLRRALAGAGGEGLVVRRAPGYALDTGNDTVDFGRFTALTARARGLPDPRERADVLAGALALWRGPAFAGFTGEPFGRDAAAALEERRLLALEEHAEARLELGEHRVLAGELGLLVAQHPLRERLRAAQMRALYGAGRPSEALDGFHELRLRLDGELGLRPGPELVALQQQILRQAPSLRSVTVRPPEPPAVALPPPEAAPLTVFLPESAAGARTVPEGAPVTVSPPEPAPRAAPRPRTNLPVPVTSLIGRSGAVEEIRSLVEGGRLVTLTGPGGVGKTRLATEVAARLAESRAEIHPDGVWLVELAARAAPGAPGGGPGAGEPAEAVAAALGVRDDTGHGPGPADGPRPLLDKLVGALRGRRLLLVLDNCEHVVEAVALLVRALLREAPGVRILATSQEPLEVAGERVRPVPPLELPADSGDPAVLRRSGAVRLFLERAAARSPGFALDEGNARAVASICRRLDGIPLALELASTRVHVLGAAQLAERLDDRFRLLTGGLRDAPARQRTLRAMIDWSWELLTAAERTVLRRVAAHSDGCTLEAAEAVCAGDGVAPAEVPELLARLVDRSLVVVVHGRDGPRYRLLESVSAYCLERLRATEYERVRAVHARWYADFAERADPGLRGADQQRWLRLADAEAANVRGALEHCRATGDGPLLRRLVRASVWYWFLRGRLTEARRWLCAAAELPGGGTGMTDGADGSDGGDNGGEGSGIRAWRTGFALLSGVPGTPGRDAAGILTAYETVRDPRERILAGWFLGYAATRFADRAVGEELIRRATAGARALGDRWGIAACLAVGGVLAYVRGDLTDSRGRARESLALFRAEGDRWGQLQALGVLGRLAEIGGDYGTADGLHRESLAIAEELELWTDASVCWSQLGRIALLTGDHDRADEYHERGRRLAVEQGDGPAEEFAELGLALTARRRGRLSEATVLLHRWLEWNRQFEAEYGTALILAELGFTAELRGDAAGALALHTEGLAAARGTGDPRAVALALEGLAGARALAGEGAAAARLLGAAAAARSAAGAPLPAAERGDVDRVTTAVRGLLGGPAFEAAYAEGASRAGTSAEGAPG